jgi:hypothetical protein
MNKLKNPETEEIKSNMDEKFLIHYQVPYCCPICNGKGIVPQGFYSTGYDGGYLSNSTTPDTCKSCGGTGIIWK